VSFFLPSTVSERTLNKEKGHDKKSAERYEVD